NDVTRAVAHGGIMSNDLRNFHGHLLRMRLLADLAVHPQFHIEIVRVGNFVSGDDPRSNRTECIDTLTETEHAGFHLTPLNITRRDIVEDDIAADVVRRFLSREMFACLFQYHCEFEFVVNFLRQMLRKNDRLIRSDNRIHILEEDDPWQNGMRKAGPLGFDMMLAKVARSMKKLFGYDRSPEFD